MSDRERFPQLNDLLTQGHALTALITPYGSDEQFWPQKAAQPWPQAYIAWYDACRAALDPDLSDLFAAIDAGDWQRPGVREVVARLAARLTAPAEQVEAARTALRDVTSRRPPLHPSGLGGKEPKQARALGQAWKPGGVVATDLAIKGTTIAAFDREQQGQGNNLTGCGRERGCLGTCSMTRSTG